MLTIVIQVLAGLMSDKRDEILVIYRVIFVPKLATTMKI